MATFEERLKLAIGPRGYEDCMRRSVQTVILFEANRAVASKLPTLRPFQRKIAFWGQANAILESLGFLQDEHKGQIMWRTATSKEPMPPETAWKRLKLIERELAKIVAMIKPILNQGRSHDDTCALFIQQQFELVTGNKGKPYPATFEFTHNNVIFCYRVFYKGSEIDESFPPPVVRQVEVPAIKPKAGLPAVTTPQQPFPSVATTVSSTPIARADNEVTTVPVVAAATVAAAAPPIVEHQDDDDDRDVDLTGIVGGDDPHEERRSILKEVREHLDLLREFEGVISQEDINKRKRELFLSLPPAPPPAIMRSRRKEGSFAGPSPIKKSREDSEP